MASAPTEVRSLEPKKVAKRIEKFLSAQAAKGCSDDTGDLQVNSSVARIPDDIMKQLERLRDGLQEPLHPENLT